MQLNSTTLLNMGDSKKIDAWATFIVSFNRIHQGMEEAMKEAGLPSLEIYDVLWTLERSPEHGLRFSELGEKVLLSRSNVTRLAERLESQGLIERKRCPNDRRGVYAVLTKTGKKLRQDMWKTYEKLIQERFSNHLSSDEHKSLIQILTKVWSETPPCSLECGQKTE